LFSELDRIADGLNVGPDDQSLWYYHQYLIRNVLGNLGDAQIAPSLTNEQREAYIEREIENFQDFLTDYESSKLLYEGLIDCKVGLARLRGQKASVDSDSELASWLSKLRELDPKHSGRWDDLEKELSVA
jgi:geranylgeranyl transferase type-2 subunit alpha